MQRIVKAALIAIVIVAASIVPAGAAETVTTSWGGDAEMIYDTGFMHMLKKHPEGGVSLFDMVAVHNDAPGAGKSEKGVSADTVWGKNRELSRIWLLRPEQRQMGGRGRSRFPRRWPCESRPGSQNYPEALCGVSVQRRGCHRGAKPRLL